MNIYEKFRDIEGSSSYDDENPVTDNSSWWEGYASALADSGLLTESEFDEFMKFLSEHTE